MQNQITNTQKERKIMNKQTTSRLAVTLRVATAVSLALLLAAVLPGAVFRVNAHKVAPASQEGGPKEGLKVHGYWVIEVHNPDGKLVSHTEFENALATQRTLTSVFSRTSVLGLWEVDLMQSGNANDSPWGSTTGLFSGPNAGRITESGQGPNIYSTLTVSKNNDNSIVLSGNATAVQNGSIGRVATSVGICDAAVTTGPCTNYTFNLQGSLLADFAFNDASMTRTAINPISVVTGQSIQVTVTISFS
jgi:hypothetical protein